VVPVRTRANGGTFGGGLFTRGQLSFILRNPVYAGDIPHRDKVYAGQHSAIIEREVWTRVQDMLSSHVQGQARRPRREAAGLLAGRIVDMTGEPMLTVHTNKGKLRYRYYVSRSRHLKKGEPSIGLRLPGREIESLVKETVARLFDDPLQLASILALGASPAVLRDLSGNCRDIAAQLRARAAGPLRDMLLQVRASDTSLEIELSTSAIFEAIGGSSAGHELPPLVLTAPYRLTRTGQALRLIQSAGTPVSAAADPALLRLILRARRWWEILERGEIDIRTLAQQEGVNDSYVTRVVRLAFLSPAVIEAVLAGRQQAGLGATIVRTGSGVPACWAKQRSLFLAM